MGCDAFADENGEFVLEVRMYHRKDRKQTNFPDQQIVLQGLEPGQEINIEMLKGTER